MASELLKEIIRRRLLADSGGIGDPTEAPFAIPFNIPDANLIDLDTVSIPAARPRLLFTPDRVAALQVRWNNPPTTTFQQCKDLINSIAGQALPAAADWGTKAHAQANARIAGCAAFVYQMTADTAMRDKAIRAGYDAATSYKEYLPGDSTPYPRQPYEGVYGSALALDWAFAGLAKNSNPTFNTYAGALFSLVNDINFGVYTTTSYNYTLSNHRMESVFGDGVLAAVAMYGQSATYNDPWNNHMKVWLKKVQTDNNWMLDSMYIPQGAGYMCERWIHMLHVMIMVKKLWAKDLLTGKNLIALYDTIYTKTPDKRIFYEEDISDATGRFSKKMASLIVASAYYKDPLLHWALENLDYKGDAGGALEGLGHISETETNWGEALMYFILQPDSRPTTGGLNGNLPSDLLCIKYSPPPFGPRVVYQSNIDFTDAQADNLAMMISAATYFTGNHQFVCVGRHETYYKGFLGRHANLYQAKKSGSIESDLRYGNQGHVNWVQKTIAQNGGLLIYRPGAPYKYRANKNTANDGGQRYPIPGTYQGSFNSNNNPVTDFGNKTDITDPESHAQLSSKISYWESQSDKSFFLAVDTAFSYDEYQPSSGALTRTANKVHRQYAHVWLGGADYKAVTFLIDKVDAVDATHQKIHTLRCEEEPTINGKAISVKRTGSYAGQLYKIAMYPANTTFDKVNGFKVPDVKQTGDYDWRRTFDFATSIANGEAVITGPYEDRDNAAWAVFTKVPTGKQYDMIIHVEVPCELTSTEPSWSVFTDTPRFIGLYCEGVVLIASKDFSQLENVTYQAPPGTTHHMIINLKPGKYNVNGTVRQAFQEENTLLFEGNDGEWTIEPALVEKDEYFAVGNPNMVAASTSLTLPAGPVLIFDEADIDLIRNKKTQWAANWSRITGRSDPTSLALVYLVDDNLNTGIDAVKAGYDLIKDVYASYEKAKDVLEDFTTAYLVYHWCHSVFDDAPGGTFTFTRADYIQKLKDRINQVPGMDTTDFNNVTSHIAGHQATGYLQAFGLATALGRDEQATFDNFFDSFFNGGGKAAQDFYVKSGKHHQGNYGAVKSTFWIFHEIAARNMTATPGKTLYHPALRWHAYYYLYQRRANKHPLPDGETNLNWYKDFHHLRTLGILAAHLYGDEILFNWPAIAGIKQYNGVLKNNMDTLQDAIQMIHDFNPTGLTTLPKVRRYSYPLSAVVAQDSFAYDKKAGYAFQFKMHEYPAGLHGSFHDAGAIDIAGEDGYLLTGSVGIYVSQGNRHNVNIIRGYGMNNPVVYDPAENWGKDKNGVDQGDKWANLGKARRPLNNEDAIDLYSQVFDAAWGNERSQVISYATDNEMAWSYVYGSVDLFKGFQGDAVNYNNRCNVITRSAIVVPFQTGQKLTLVLDRIDPTDTSFTVMVPWWLQGAPTVDNASDPKRYVSYASSGNSKIAIYPLQPADYVISAVKNWKTPDGNDYFEASTDADFEEKGGGDRLEIKAGTTLASNRFLAALLSMPAADAAPPAADFYVDQDAVRIVVQVTELVFVFATDKGLLSSVTFNIQDAAYSSYKVHVMDMQHGTYSQGSVGVGENILKFTAAAGNHTVQL